MTRKATQHRRMLNAQTDIAAGPVLYDRRRFLRASVLGLGGLAIASLTAACGSSSSPAPTAAPTNRPAAAAPVAAPATTPVAAPVTKPAQAAPGGFSGGGSLKLLMRSHFIPAYDTWFDKFAQDWGAKHNVAMEVDHILAGELPAKWAAEVATGAGHDILGFTQGGAVNLFNRHLVDVSDLAKQFGQAHGGWVNPLAEHIGMYEGIWRGVPDFFIDFPANYRKDLFDANGLKPVDTWDDLMKVGKVLKEQDHPIGIAINQKSNDANNSWNGFLWTHGASYVAEDGKTVTIDSAETRDAVGLGLELYRQTMTNEVLSWDDTANNQFLGSGRGAWIQNPISALRTIEKNDAELAKKIAISNTPAGPKGRFTPVSTSIWGIMSWSQNVPAAKAFLSEYYANYLVGMRAAEGYNQPLLKEFRKKPMPILGEDPRLTILQDFDQAARVVGYPGPPTPAAAEVEQNWIIPLMMGRAVQTGNANEAVDWAAAKVEAIYARYR